ncbi:MAG: biotin carboxylase N-terminal domain-containing protein [Nitratireductor sp.]
MIARLLIANRGEIACRIAATARRMGIATVAVYSDADRAALHVRQADEAVRIGEAQASLSYLDGDAVIAAARATGAEAIHPGYGFLSENADFAEACQAAGLVFVGPPPDAIRVMGDKAGAKAVMVEAGVPVVPGYDGADQSAGRLAAAAREIGFPVLIKAAAGGGGRGMRRVDRAEAFEASLESARREAEAAFGDGRVLLEKLVTEARHVEVQVFADAHGNVVHMGERDCSAQRRHQKIVEETPSPFVDAAMGAAMAVDAIAATRAVNYVGAGTVEFIVGADRQHHFLEMNTRLQVEHPVTEMVTGIDLVEWQLRVAAGEPLPLREEDIDFFGHAIEARLYAEDPADGFRPQTGEILFWQPQVKTGEAGIRIDSGVAAGDRVSPHYDPMIAKLVAHGRNRDEAIDRLVRALRARPLFGLTTNRGFLIDLLEGVDFRQGGVTTGFIDDLLGSGRAAMGAQALQDWHFALAGAVLALGVDGDWFRSSGIAACPLTLICGDETRVVVVEVARGLLSTIRVDGDAVALTEIALHGQELRYVHAGTPARATVFVSGRTLWLDMDGHSLAFRETDPLAARPPVADASRVTAPVTGLLRSLAVVAGDSIEAGDTLAVIEAMKMETALAATVAGTVRAVHRGEGEQVGAGDLLIELDPGPQDPADGDRPG